MRSIKKQIILLMIGSSAIAAICLILVFYFQSSSAAVAAGRLRARTDLDIVESILDLRYPGSWTVKKGELYKGKTNLTNYFAAADDIKNLTGNECVIFLKNICVSTTVPVGDCDRAVGVYAPYEVTSKVLEVGPQYYTGQANLSGRFYHTSYKPIKTDYGEIIGVLYVGVPALQYDDFVYHPIQMAGLTGLGLIIAAGIGGQLFVNRLFIKPASRTAGQAGQITPHDLTARHAAPQQTEEMNILPETGDGPTDKQDNESAWLDTLLGLQQELPKGLNDITLREIVLFLKHQEGDDITIQDLSDAVSISKVTVRHYLDYLSEKGLVIVEQKYGSVGRPLRIYRLK